MTTKIEWTDRTINFVYGCTKASPGCLNCYAEKMSQRQVNMGNYPPEVVRDWRWTREVVCDEEAMHRAFDSLPKKKPCRVFVCSMSDLFHDAVPGAFIERVFLEMLRRPHITFQILTKRPENLVSWWRSSVWRINGVNWPRNIWPGVTVEDQRRAGERIPWLLMVPAFVRFLSVEPTLEFVNISLGLFTQPPQGVPDESPEAGGLWCPRVLAGAGVSWVICGAETGTEKRPMNLLWARSLRDQCARAGVPFFFKKDSGGRGTLDGVEYHEFPETT